MIEEPPILTLKKSFPRPGAAQIEAFRGLPTGFVCDAMHGQGALDSSVAPIGFGRDIECTAVGPALVAENGPAEILATMGALYMLEPGDIVVSATHGHRNCSASGDLFMGMLKNKGAAGFVTDGEMRDYDDIVRVGLPVWCAGLSPNSPFAKGPGRVGFGANLAGQRIESGDLLVCDRNGVVVVPHSEIDRVIERIARIKELEAEFEAKVAAGYCDMPEIEEMIADGRAAVVE